MGNHYLLVINYLKRQDNKKHRQKNDIITPLNLPLLL